MNLKHFSAILLFVAPALAAAETHQYISDEITLSIRDQPNNSATVVGSAQSGDAVTVLQTLGEQSFARIRTAAGVEGWVTARYLSNHPAAKDELTQLRQQLDAAHKQVETLQQQVDSANKQLAEIKPAQELAAENKTLHATLADKEREAGELISRYDDEKQRRQTLLVGGALVGVGILLGLTLPWLGRRKRRRYSDF